MSLSRIDLMDQVSKDQAYFDRMRANVKNALVEELKKIWPKSGEVWPNKFVDHAKVAATGGKPTSPVLDPNKSGSDS